MKKVKSDLSTISDVNKTKREAESVISDTEKTRLAEELDIAREEKTELANELIILNAENAERAAELVIANAEKAKRAVELVIANAEKAKRDAALMIANLENAKRADELIIADKELAYQIEEKVKRAAEVVIAEVNKTKLEAELVIARIEKANLIAKSIIAGKELSFQTEEKSKRAAELIIADAEKSKRAAKLVIANIKKAKRSAELIIENVEKAKRSAELVIANKELVYQKSEKSKRAAELIIANVEKAKRAAELVIAKIEKSKRAAEFVFMIKELVLAKEKEKLVVELTIVNKELTHQIEKRIQVESDLIKAKEKAEESDRLKSAFLTNMSHEIRTPMNGIVGFAELLKMPGLSGDEQQEYIDYITKSSDRMLSIIDDLVDISKIEAGLVKVDHDQSNINEQTEFVYNSFKLQAEAKGLNLCYRNGMPEGKAIITTDKKKVDSILSNLVKNAIKYTADGTIEFGYKFKPIVQSSSHEVASDALQFYVKDTGIGIPVDRQQAIFDRFVQADIADKMAYQGIGLGLSIAKAYVEMMNGKLWVESIEGKGSTFYFTIPYIALSEEKTTIDKVVSAAHEEEQIKKLKILIVEDDEISYSLLSRMLGKISKDIMHAISGVQAVETCGNNPDLDLVLMDLRMPKMNGLEATQQIREFNKDVIIIAQTAYAFTGDSERAIEAGCNDYISKPINKDKLLNLVEKYFQKHENND